MDLVINIPGHPDCFGVESGAGEWLSVYRRTGGKPIHVGDYPCETDQGVITHWVTVWKYMQEHAGGQGDSGDALTYQQEHVGGQESDGDAVRPAGGDMMDKAMLGEIVNNRHPFYPYPTDQVEEIITALRDAWEQLELKTALAARCEASRADRDAT